MQWFIKLSFLTLKWKRLLSVSFTFILIININIIIIFFLGASGKSLDDIIGVR